MFRVSHPLMRFKWPTAQAAGGFLGGKGVGGRAEKADRRVLQPQHRTHVRQKRCSGGDAIGVAGYNFDTTDSVELSGAAQHPPDLQEGRHGGVSVGCCEHLLAGGPVRGKGKRVDEAVSSASMVSHIRSSKITTAESHTGSRVETEPSNQIYSIRYNAALQSDIYLHLYLR